MTWKFSDDAGLDKGVADDNVTYKMIKLTDKKRDNVCGSLKLGFKYMQAEATIEAHHQQTVTESAHVDMELRALFNELDLDGSGTIERAELEKALTEGKISAAGLKRLGIDDPTAEGCAAKLFDDMNEVGPDGVKDDVGDEPVTWVGSMLNLVGGAPQPSVADAAHRTS